MNNSVKTVLLMDNDDKIKGKGINIIKKFEDVIVPDGEAPETTLLKLAMDGSIKKALESHNEKRTSIVNRVTLERTGNEVKLAEIDIDDVSILIK